MKRRLLLVNLLSIVFFATGCISIQEKSTLQRIADGAKLATYMGVGLDLVSHPERLPAYREARRGVSQLLINERFNASDLAMYLQTALPVGKLDSPTSSIIFGAVTLALSDQLGSIEVENPEEVRVMALAIKTGLDLALAPYEGK